MVDFNEKNQPESPAAQPAETEPPQSSEKGSFALTAAKETFKLARDIFLIIAVFILAGVFIVQPVVVEGTSMAPLLHDGERLLVNKLIYYNIKSVEWGHIERGDIVVFWYPNDPQKSYVKRVVGLPGETVEIVSGKVLIDGQELNEDYVTSEHNQTLASFPPRMVDQHYYFVMGDNRDNSSDSRYWGLVPEKYIYGKVFFRYWKPGQTGFINHGRYEIDPSEERREETMTEEAK